MRAFTVLFTLASALLVAAQADQAAPPCLTTCSGTPPADSECLQLPLHLHNSLTLVAGPCLQEASTEAIGKCLCEDTAFREVSTKCLQTTCETKKEYDDSQVIAVGICAQVGVILQPITTGWVGPSESETGAPSGSGSASVTPSITNGAGSTTGGGSAPTSTGTTPGDSAFGLTVPAAAVFGGALLAMAL